jgi:energy-coupling factor transporter ATP-binding protein EcfA2
MCCCPPILVADEPTGNLNSRTADDVLTLFQKMVDDDKTVVLMTHEQDVASWVSRVLTLADGEIVTSSPARHTKNGSTQRTRGGSGQSNYFTTTIRGKRQARWKASPDEPEAED